MKQRPFFGVEERVSIIVSLLGGIQHLLAMFVGIITPPLIIAAALRLDTGTTGFLVSMALFSSGITTFIQVKLPGPGIKRRPVAVMDNEKPLPVNRQVRWARRILQRSLVP